MSKTRKNKGFPKKGDPITQTQESKEKKTRKSSKKSKSPKRKRVVSDDSEYESDDDEHDLDIPSDDPEDDFNTNFTAPTIALPYFESYTVYFDISVTPSFKSIVNCTSSHFVPFSNFQLQFQFLCGFNFR